MVVPFNKRQPVHGRYELLTPQPVLKQLEKDGADMSRYDGQEYATFIRSLGVTDVKTQQKLSRPKAKPTVMQQMRSTKSTESSKSTTKDSTSSFIRGAKSAPPSAYHSLQTINQIKMKNQEDHNKKMKVVEDYMFYCKQQERELKRVEGDILKGERSLKKTMKEYETEIYSDQRMQEAQINLAAKDENLVKKQYYKDESKITKDKINRNINNIQQEKEGENKSINTLNGLEFKFENIAEAINLKRKEVNSLVKEFEMKMRQKQEEEFRLKKEFANLSLELNIAAQKHRVQTEAGQKNSASLNQKDKIDQARRTENYEDQLRWQKNRTNEAERSKRRLSKDLHDITSTMSMHEREEGRRLMDIKSKLDTNALNQREAKIKAQLLEMERQGVKSEEKILVVNARRKAIQDMITEQRKQKNDQSMDEWRQRNSIVTHKTKKQDLEDNISHFQKVVAKQEDLEHALYNQVRQLETDRKNQEQTVDRLKEELYKTQKLNKALLRETAVRCRQQENELQQRLQKEEAQLGKALSEREERIQTLVKCRGSSREDKHMLTEEKKIHNRLIRIEKKSDLLRQKQHEDVY